MEIKYRVDTHIFQNIIKHQSPLYVGDCLYSSLSILLKIVGDFIELNNCFHQMHNVLGVGLNYYFQTFFHGIDPKLFLLLILPLSQGCFFCQANPTSFLIDKFHHFNDNGSVGFTDIFESNFLIFRLHGKIDHIEKAKV